MIIHKIRSVGSMFAAVLVFALCLVGIGTPAEAFSRENFLGDNPSGKRDWADQSSFKQKFSQPQTSTTATPPAFQAECPPTVRCVVMPAAFSANNGDVGDYGNYDRTNRPHDGMKIDSIVVHDTEGSLQSVLDAFKDPTFYASSHYVIAADGTIYQMVQNKDIAWHAGNWSVNMHSIGIEHVGYAAKSESYTPQMYYASQQLVKYLSNKYGIPKDRAHIMGHDNVPVRGPDRLTNMHVDPGPFWNWESYMQGIGSPIMPRFSLSNNAVTIAPHWSFNKQRVTGCWDDAKPDTCVPDKLQPTNFVYLRSQPNHNAPYFTDSATGQGDTTLLNNAARLFHGQTFALKDKKIEAQGTWYEVWVNGKTGWFFSPWATPTAFATNTKTVTPKPGSSEVAVYGRAVPELSEYPADLLAVPPASTFIPGPTPLPYKITSNQQYALTDAAVPTHNFYAWAIDASFPYDHTLFKGKTKYVQVQLGNRLGYVKAADVIVK